MRKLYISIFSLTIAGLSFGQVTLNAADINATVGETFNYTQSSYTSPGSAGANQTWDISSVSTIGTGSVNFTPANGSFPQTNISQEDSGGGTLYEDMSSSAIDIWGTLASGVTITYSNPMTFIGYPLTMGTSGTDSHLATFTSSGYNFTRAGNSTWDGDGYGTLITPNGTYTNVLRVLITQIYTDTYSLGTIDYDVEIYAWFKAGIHYPVAEMVTLTTFQGTQQYGIYITGSVGLEEENSEEFSVFPNPANDLINVVTTGNNVDLVRVADISGKVVLEEASTSLNVAGLNKGVYLVSVLYKDGTRSKTTKIVKQ